MVEDSRLALRIRKGEAMEHYCKYCGRKLRRGESSCPICNGQRRRRHRKWPLVLAAALAVLMTAAIAVGLFWMRRRLMENQPSAEALRTQALTLRVDGVLSSPVEDAEAAASALCAAGKNLGFSNALAELTTYTTQTVEGITCYRMQQNFGGVPVYGRTVSLLTNEEGKTLLLAGNVEDLNENTICNQPRDGTADMAAALGAYYDGSEVELADAAPVLYLLQTENGWYYAHQVYAHVEGVGTVEALVDAESGQVLSTLQRERNVDTILESWSTIRNSDPDLRNIEGYLVRTTEGDDGYYLIDSVRNIYIYDLQGKKYDAEKKPGSGSGARTVILSRRLRPISIISVWPMTIFTPSTVIRDTAFSLAASMTEVSSATIALEAEPKMGTEWSPWGNTILPRIGMSLAMSIHM